MADEAEDYVNYCGFWHVDKNKQLMEVTISPDLDVIKDHITGELNSKKKIKDDKKKKSDEDKKRADKEVSLETSKSESPVEQLANLLWRFQTSMEAYQTLNLVGTSLVPIMRSFHIESSMYSVAKKNYKLIDENEGFFIFGVTEDHLEDFSDGIKKLRQLDRAIDVFPDAILLSLVATFDSVVADAIRILLRATPDRFSSSDRAISLKELLSMNSFEEVIHHTIEEEVNNQMRGSHEDQISYIEQNLNVDIKKNYDEWSQFIEIFERRNLATHGNSIVNSYYLQNCNRNGLVLEDVQIGDKLNIDRKYLTESAQRLLEFGVLLIFVLWRKNFPKTDQNPYHHLNLLTYEMIRQGEYYVSSRILEFALFKQKPNVEDRQVKMMTVNLANALKMDKKNDRSKEIIDKVDWSATSDDFKMCIYSLKENVEEFVKLMPVAVKSGALTKADIREWPVFEWVRDKDIVSEKFTEIFNEPIILPVAEREVELPKMLKDNIESDDTTVH